LNNLCRGRTQSLAPIQVIEVKAGMDILEIYKDYGSMLSFMGGIDVRALSHIEGRS